MPTAAASSAVGGQFLTTLRHDLESIKREYAGFIHIEDFSEAAASALEQDLENQQQQQQEHLQKQQQEVQAEGKEKTTTQEEISPKDKEVSQLQKTVAEGVGALCFRMNFVQEPDVILVVHFDHCGYTVLNAEEVVQQLPHADDPPVVGGATPLQGPYETIEQLLLALRPRAFERYQVQHVAAKLLRQ